MSCARLVRLVPLLLLAGTAPAAQPPPPNVLFIVADDLGPMLGSYGNREVRTPHLDRLAARSLQFNRAYCQQAICNPSRASLMTGLRPDTIGVYDLVAHFRDKRPDLVTLPQHFKNHGYHTRSYGKIYHAAFSGTGQRGDGDRGRLDDPPSWSVPAWRGEPRYYYTDAGIAEARRVFAATRKKSGAEVDEWTGSLVRGLATEAPDVPDNVLHDGELTDHAIRALYELAERQKFGVGNRQPFFLAVGYLKPHMPFVAPKRYWDLYDRQKLTLAKNNHPPKDAPPIALQVFWNEMRAQSDIPDDGPLTEAMAREFVHGYYACISFVDAQIGRLLAELERTGLAENTIVVLWGDHGYHLGEHSLWAKLTNFEGATRSPLIIHVPRAKHPGAQTDALVEFVDLYPSLSELAGLPVPAGLEGTSFAPLFEDPKRPWKTAAFSQYWRRGYKVYRTVPLAIPNPPGYDRYPETDTMGYSMRTDRYRYTVWHPVQEPDRLLATELYDYQVDPQESANLAARPEYAAVVRELAEQMRRGWPAARPATP
jgi:arylsulfatase A-like enzyme